MLEKIPDFAGLDKAHLNQLEKISRPFQVKKGFLLFAPGDPTQGFYAVHAGAVRLYSVSSKGREITQQIFDAGSTLAEASLYSDAYPCYAEALKDSTVSLVPKDEFLRAIQNNSPLAATWIRLLSLKIQRQCHRIEELSTKSPRERIASYLLLLSELQGTAAVELPGYRKSIATLLAMTHETFYRIAKGLEKEQLVRFDNLRVEILNRPMLEEIIG